MTRPSKLDPVFPPGRILAALDGTAPSKAAWRRVAALKKQFQSKSEAVTVKVAGGQAPGKLSEWTDGDTETFVREGSPSGEIVRLAAARKADLIVLGTNARKGLERLLEGGSVAEAVVRRSGVPVWVEKGTFKVPDSVLVPVNFTDYSDRALAYAIKVALAFEARITLMHVLRDKVNTDVVKRRLYRRLGKLTEELKSGRRARMEIVIGDPGRAIAHRSRKYGLVVLAAHRKSLLEEWTVGTTAERVIRHSPVPTLAVPSQDE